MRLPALSPAPAVVDTATVAPVAAVHRAAPAAAISAPLTAGNAPANDVHALRELVDKLSQTIGTTGRQVQIGFDRDTHQTILRVTDAESVAVLRQIPGDEALSMARTLDRMQGILIRQKA